jgi:hypothetical protein
MTAPACDLDQEVKPQSLHPPKCATLLVVIYCRIKGRDATVTRPRPIGSPPQRHRLMMMGPAPDDVDGEVVEIGLGSTDLGDRAPAIPQGLAEGPVSLALREG